MSRDYKHVQSERGNGGGHKPMNPFFMGIIIGLLLGVSIALGVALWLNKNAIPFMERSKPLEPPPKIEAKREPAQPGKTEPPKTAEPGKAGDKPRFEFYQILPGDKDGTSKAPAKKVDDGKPAPKPADKPSEKTADKSGDKADKAPDKTASTGGREHYYLQAGAFQSATEADNLKAKIAFIGLQATVVTANVPEKGVLHRVRLGPYQSLDDVNRIKAALSDNGVAAAVVKTTDTLN
jgi:cell division protein FtsN